ncbi:myogenesis-regulating glycosidase isoform X2 [Anabrus simplex]|uniref:myogenesis-regulating glycosidase isoform X2 n=1 Tax=Anabrus simplex TaxID=316456 RepID=UPI0035A2F986
MTELKPVSVGAEEMSWADAGNGRDDEEDLEGDEASELLEPSSSNVPRIRIIRRNSISLPAGLNAMDSPDLQLTPDSSQQGDLSDNSFTDGDGDDGGESEEEFVRGNIPPRSQRRKSVMPPPPTLKINDVDYLDVPETSPGNSITSINSIASLLKEKLALSLPTMMKRKQREQPQEYKLQIFVGFLFMCIVSLVGFSYVYYHQQVLQRAYFDRIRFNNNDRIVKVFNNHGHAIIFGHLGTGLGQDTAFRCLQKDELNDGSVCMEWMHKSRLYIHYKQIGSSRCYRITWQSLSEGLFPTDCYDWSGHGHWYGGGQTQGMKWPVEQGQVKMAPFVTGDTRIHQWGNVLNGYFVNSNGVTIFIDPNTPLYVSVNAENTKKFCLQAKYDNFAYVYRHRPLPQLNYSMCTSSNMTSLHSYLFRNPLYNLTEDEREVIHTIMTEPVWHITPPTSEELTEILISNYTEEVIALGFFRQGHVLLNEYWQADIGDFLVDSTRFPTMDTTINVMQRRGFRIIFTLQPFVSTESVNFRETVKEGFLVTQRATEHNIPTLTRYKNVQSAGVLDLTNTRTVPWLQTKLQSLVEKYKIDAFYVDVGSAYDMPYYYRFKSHLTNPDQYKAIFTESIRQQVDVVGMSGAITRPKGPVFVSLPPYPSSWESLRAIIPTVLTYGVIGYPLVMPGPVGGDYLLTQLQESDNATDSQTLLMLPEKELYMRWMQLATFLPVMSFKYLPNKYGDEKVVEMAKVLTNLRVKTVNPIVKKYIEALGDLDEGLPLIRPLWMLDHADPICHSVVDEFLVGDELIVAPILTNNATMREVYLPAGVWKDGIDGNLRKGSRWLHHHMVPLDKIAYFVRMPDNTRF